MNVSSSLKIKKTQKISIVITEESSYLHQIIVDRIVIKGTRLKSIR